MVSPLRGRSHFSTSQPTALPPLLTGRKEFFLKGLSRALTFMAHNLYCNNTLLSIFTAALFKIGKICNQPRYQSTVEWVRKRESNGYISVITGGRTICEGRKGVREGKGIGNKLG